MAGFPTAAIQDLGASKSAVILNIDPETAAKLKEQYPYYSAITIPAGTYPGQEADVGTVCVKCLLIGTDKMSDDMGGQIAKILYTNLDRLIAAHSVGKLITKDSALDGMSIPMNAGAEKYLKS